MSVNGLNDHKVFVQQHKNQLEESGVPEHLWATLHNKLKHGVSTFCHSTLVIFIE